MSALNVEVKTSCEKSLPIYQQTWRQTPEHFYILFMKILGRDTVQFGRLSGQLRFRKAIFAIDRIEIYQNIGLSISGVC
jgi:hypothetical protein